VEWVEGPSAAELGAAVGKEITAAVGVLDAALANGIRAAAFAAVKSV
jgi:ribosomal protein L7Ae-like RNA K-turn-binding protein